MSNVDEYTDFSQADKELCRKARQPSSDDAYSAAFIPADLLAVLKSGYQMHDSWRSKAADTIERLQGLNTDLELLAKKRATLLKQAKQERDAAITSKLADLDRSQQALHKAESDRESLLAEVERLKGELRGVYSDQAASDQARIEIRRKSDAMGR